MQTCIERDKKTQSGEGQGEKEERVKILIF